MILAVVSVVVLKFRCMSECYGLFQIGQHFKDGYLHKNEFKIVYVAPMKVKPTHTLLFPPFPSPFSKFFFFEGWEGTGKGASVTVIDRLFLVMYF